MTNIQIQQSQIKTFQTKILSWYAEHQRDLPWRQNRDPYRILVSEVMLQQTQVSRVIPKYTAWFAAFPTLDDLAKAPISEVLRLWSGLGYNRRALFLQRTAKAIVFEHAGTWPQTEEDLKKLPGIGEYTAAAIACFAFDQQVAVVDTNVKKVILLEFFCHCEEGISPTRQSQNDRELPIHDEKRDCFTSLAMTTKDLQKIADQLLPPGRAYDWNQALMDYASAILKKEKIPVQKQSKFLGSRRYFRGKILKFLLQKHTIPRSDISLQLRDEQSSVDEATLDSILGELERDGFIKQTENTVKIADK